MSSSFVQIGKQHPCNGCPAPCCNIHLTDSKTPLNFMDLDWFRYSLNFPDQELGLAPNGSFTLIRWVTCMHFDDETRKCKVHDTDAQPRTCVYYNPWKCWYKDNFTTSHPPDLVRMNRPRFEAYLSEVILDSTNMIVSRPDFERTRAITQGIPIESRPRAPL